MNGRILKLILQILSQLVVREQGNYPKVCTMCFEYWDNHREDCPMEELESLIEEVTNECTG